MQTNLVDKTWKMHPAAHRFTRTSWINDFAHVQKMRHCLHLSISIHYARFEACPLSPNHNRNLSTPPLHTPIPLLSASCQTPLPTSPLRSSQLRCQSDSSPPAPDSQSGPLPAITPFQPQES